MSDWNRNTQKEVTIHGIHPRELFLQFFRTQSELSRSIRGEKDSYRITQTDENIYSLDRARVKEHCTIEMYKQGTGELDFVSIDYLVSGGRVHTDEEGREYSDYLITLSTPKGQKHETSAVMFLREYKDEEDVPRALKHDVEAWRTTFNDFIQHAHILHYKNMCDM